MSNITWTHELRLRMYEELLNDLGNNPLHFNSRGKPHSMSKAQWFTYLDGVAITLGLPSGKGGALSNQIAWVFCTPSAKCHKGHHNNMMRNLTAANLVGWVIRGTPVPQKVVPTVTPVSTPKPSKLKVVAKVAAIVGTGIALAMGIPIIL